MTISPTSSTSALDAQLQQEQLELQKEQAAALLLQQQQAAEAAKQTQAAQPDHGPASIVSLSNAATALTNKG